MNSKTFFCFFLLIPVLMVCLCGCTAAPVPPSGAPAEYRQNLSLLSFDPAAWHYDAENRIYWQIGVPYCSRPQAPSVENMAIYVPAPYLTGIPNGDGTYTCTDNASGIVNGFTVDTAPIVFPMNTGGYSAQSPATSYQYPGIANYTGAGFVYVYAGLRGRANGYDSNGTLAYSGGAPWGVTDLKAAIRYYRYHQDLLPGSTDRIAVFGMSGGGAQTAVTAASGDSRLYDPYLTSIGAAMTGPDGEPITDAIWAAMCWCPITSLDFADEAYEWNMGQYADTGTRSPGTWTAALSDDMARTYGPYLNDLHLVDENGTVLSLEETKDGIYTSGTYAAYLQSVIEQSLNNFLQDTSFPYTKTAGSFRPDGGFGGGGPGEMNPGARLTAGGMPPGMPGGAPGSESGMAPVTYQTAREYIDSLNTDSAWVTYDEATNTATITDIRAFVTHCKNPSKAVPAFDDLNRTQAENDLFGTDTHDHLHFDQNVADLLQNRSDIYAGLQNWNASLVPAYQRDLQELDSLGSDIPTRQNMYNPMYYLCDYYDGYQNATLAPQWRIRSGINQGDTALTVEINLNLALSRYPGVRDVDFETVWGEGHTTAERTGTSTGNFIDWVTRISREE